MCAGTGKRPEFSKIRLKFSIFSGNVYFTLIKIINLVIIKGTAFTFIENRNPLCKGTWPHRNHSRLLFRTPRTYFSWSSDWENPQYQTRFYRNKRAGDGRHRVSGKIKAPILKIIFLFHFFFFFMRLPVFLILLF